MKKMIKWMLVLGIVFCLVGTGVVTAGAMMGGMQELKQYVIEYDHRFDGEDLISSGEYMIEESSAIEEVCEAEEPMSDNWTVYQNVTSMEITGGAGQIILQEIESLASDEIGISHQEPGMVYEIVQQGTELEIRLPRSGQRDYEMETLMIGVPSGFRFQEFDLELLGGEFLAVYLAANQLSMDVAAGIVEIESGEVDEISVDVAAGRVDCQAAAKKRLSVENNAGEICMVLEAGKDDYDYELECSGGSILLNGYEPEEISQIYGEKKIINHTGRQVEIECNMGSVSIDYQEKEEV